MTVLEQLREAPKSLWGASSEAYFASFRSPVSDPSAAGVVLAVQSSGTELAFMPLIINSDQDVVRVSVGGNVVLCFIYIEALGV